MALTLPEQEVPEEQLPYPNLVPVVFCRLKQTTRLRNRCLQVARSPWLDYVSVLIIVLNCVNLSIYKPGEMKTNTQKILDFLVFFYFIVEMSIKVVALGFICNKGSYLSNHWYKLDFIINVGKLLDIMFDIFDIPLQFFQVLSPLQLISRVPSMHHVVTVLLGTVPMLANVMVFCIFFIQIPAIVGVQLWGGQLRNLCFLGEDIPTKYNVSLSPYYINEEKLPFICSRNGESGTQHCRDVPPFHKNGSTCVLASHQFASTVNGLDSTGAGASVNACFNWNIYYNVCRPADHNLSIGANYFDDIVSSWITIFQVVTLEGWTEIMFYTMDAYS
ncbi:hypothetical protein FQN60_011498 [Etheostoma spectabile]|uniref:Ion transport domain-containing protein n=2 Tax=Etheostoma spectabile TaxID=54343 RepID=A0A5J5CA11_9PERO|nr:hypothetical protein FQN60_011498 [Etheostoma spectabile]